MSILGVKRRHSDDDDDDDKDENRPAKKKQKTIDERVKAFFAGNEPGPIYGYQTKQAVYIGDGHWELKKTEIKGKQVEERVWVDAKREEVECKIPKRHASQSKYLAVLGLKSKFSQKFCMAIFMYFTPRERLTTLMKFWRVWRDHFKNETRPWRWVTLCDEFPNVSGSPVYVYMSSLTVYRGLASSIVLCCSESGDIRIWLHPMCLDETCRHSFLLLVANVRIESC
jgi:hypothetical protein